MSKAVTRTIDVNIIQNENIYANNSNYKDSNTEVQVLMDRFIKGDKGDKGDPPTRGVDYWTDKDIQEFKDYCVNVITQQWFGTEAQYDYMVAHGMIQDDWIYFIYEDQGQQQPSYIDGNTLVINGAVLTDDNTTLQVYGYLENINTTLVLDNQI